MLKTNDTSRLDVAKVKRMRAVMSSETPAWLTEFFDEGGYTAVLARLKELLDMEWREEQHDDNLLHELLRCFLALSSTECGRQALTSSLPTPYIGLASLLYSEKRPGDLSTRKVLVDLLATLADLPGPALPRDAMREVQAKHVTSSLVTHVNASRASPPHFALLMTLVHNERDTSKEAIVDFIAATHTPRPFKSLVTELLNVIRDYFWVFCHGSNRFWSMRDINIADVQCPKVPGGMTGGVEFEAMAYQTSLMRLINLLASRVGHIAKREGPTNLAYDFHRFLFNSGMQKALVISRKASQVYYQPLHLELSRYFDYARRAGFSLPAELEMYQSAPQFLRSSASTKVDDTAAASSTAFLPLPSSGSAFALSVDKAHASADDGQRRASPVAAPKETVERKAPAAAAPQLARPGAQLSVVGKAVRQWEQLASPNQHPPNPSRLAPPASHEKPRSRSDQLHA